MTKVRINASAPYDVIMGQKLLPDAGALISETRPDATKVAVISDEKVFSIYGSTLLASLEKANFYVTSFVFPEGESSKNLDTLGKALMFLSRSGLTRTDLVVALGGGVVGDLAGFASAVYLRGIDFVQIPTTILAAVDSSVGGKTAVDLPTGKNLVGAFHQPSLVICDTECFHTLDKRQVACGYSEIIKYGLMCDIELFEALEERSLDIGAVVKRCVEIKRDVVEKDEFDRGDRKLLNLGHTAGHAVENLSNFSLNHGEAVAVGMMLISKIAEKRGYTRENICPRLEKLLKNYSLPTRCDFSASEIFTVAAGDKKTEGASITLVIPERIGGCILKKLPLGEFSDMLSEII